LDGDGRKAMFSSLTHQRAGMISAMSTGGQRPKDKLKNKKMVDYNTQDDNKMPETITMSMGKP